MKVKYPAISPITEDKSKAWADVHAHTNKHYSRVDTVNRLKAAGIKSTREGFYSYFPRDKYARLYGSDKMTQAHEDTHQINSEIGDKYGKGMRNHTFVQKLIGLYVLNDTAFVVDEPATTIQKVAANVPQQFRSGGLEVYDLYLVKQASAWGTKPLYLADEWVAYTNGAQVALELAQAGDGDSNRWSEIQNAIYFNMFVCILYSMVPNEQIKEMVQFQLNRVKGIYDASQKFAQLQRKETDVLLDSFYKSEFARPFSVPDKLDGYDTGQYL